jgi:CheY-like chemotaxis protein
MDGRPAPNSKPTVLIVDDEPAIRHLLAASLRSDGYDVIEAADGQDAIRAVEAASSLDVVVSDIYMPYVNGFSLAIALRESRPELSVVFMSGYPVDHALISAQTFMLRKPFLRSELLSTVREAVARRN